MIKYNKTKFNTNNVTSSFKIFIIKLLVYLKNGDFQWN